MRPRWIVPIALAVSAAAPAAATAAAGVVYGGVTADRWPVMVEVSKSGRQLVRAAIGLDLSCTSGNSYSDHDNFAKLPIKKRRFGLSYGPVTQRFDDGTTADYEGSIHGHFNATRMRVSGTWQLTEKFYDGTGKLTDTCRSGVNWSARQ